MPRTKEEEEQRLRETIRRHLANLELDLGSFAQTTHGMFLASTDIKGVAELLVKAHNNPTAYNISSLSQYLDHFTKQES